MNVRWLLIRRKLFAIVSCSPVSSKPIRFLFRCSSHFCWRLLGINKWNVSSWTASLLLLNKQFDDQRCNVLIFLVVSLIVWLESLLTGSLLLCLVVYPNSIFAAINLNETVLQEIHDKVFVNILGTSGRLREGSTRNLHLHEKVSLRFHTQKPPEIVFHVFNLFAFNVKKTLICIRKKHLTHNHRDERRKEGSALWLQLAFQMQTTCLLCKWYSEKLAQRQIKVGRER